MTVFHGEDWAAGTAENAVVEAASPLANDRELRRQFVRLSPIGSDYNFESEAFCASIRGETSVLGTARVARDAHDPSKRNAKLNVVDSWKRPLTPDADVSHVTVVKRGSLVRVTGVVETSKLTFKS